MPYFPAPSTAGGSPGGTTGQVQYNGDGTFAGAALLRVDVSGQLAYVALTGSQLPPTPASGSGVLFSRFRAGRVMPGWIGPSGMDYPLMPHMGMNRVYYVGTQMGQAALTVINMTASFTGSVSAQVFAATNVSSSLNRISLQSANGAASAAGLYGNFAGWWIGTSGGLGGFYSVMRGCIASGSSGSTNTMFVGFHSGVAAPITSNPSALFNTLGVGMDTGDTQYQFMHNAGTGAAVKISTGIARTVGDVFEFRCFAKPGMNGVSGSIGMSFELLSVAGTGTPGAGTIFAQWANSGTGNIPAGNQVLSWRMYNATTSGGVRFAPMSVFIETDD